MSPQILHFILRRSIEAFLTDYYVFLYTYLWIYMWRSSLNTSAKQISKYQPVSRERSVSKRDSWRTFVKRNRQHCAYAVT